MRAKRVLEVGTSNGYSTLWLSWAVSTTNGPRLMSVTVPIGNGEELTYKLRPGQYESIDNGQ